MASNVPATDTSARVIPGASAVSEWGVWFNGAIATCVEAATTVLGAVYNLWPANQATDKSITQQWITSGAASPNGSSNWQAASDYLTAHGLPNTAYGPGQMQGWQGIVNAALAQGEPVLFGFWDPTNGKLAPTDTWTGTRPETGVMGHAVTIVGADSSGYIVADPNSAAAQTGGFVHYTAADLARVASSMVVPDTSPVGAQTLSFNQSTGTGPNWQLPGWLQQIVANMPVIGTGAQLGGDIAGTPAGQGIQSGAAGAGGAVGSAVAGGTIWDGIAGLATQFMEQGTLIVVGMALLFLGIVVFFFAGQVGGKAPVEHAATAAKLAAG